METVDAGGVGILLQYVAKVALLFGAPTPFLDWDKRGMADRHQTLTGSSTTREEAGIVGRYRRAFLVA
jgi:hypothetical protein